jgi:hypothetical protein
MTNLTLAFPLAAAAAALLAADSCGGIPDQPAAVKEDHLDDGAVSEAKLANAAVTTTKLADNAVTGNKIASAVILPGHLKEAGDGSGFNVDLLDGKDSTDFAPAAHDHSVPFSAVEDITTTTEWPGALPYSRVSGGPRALGPVTFEGDSSSPLTTTMTNYCDPSSLTLATGGTYYIDARYRVTAGTDMGNCRWIRCQLKIDGTVMSPGPSTTPLYSVYTNPDGASNEGSHLGIVSLTAGAHQLRWECNRHPDYCAGIGFPCGGARAFVLGPFGP